MARQQSKIDNAAAAASAPSPANTTPPIPTTNGHTTETPTTPTANGQAAAPEGHLPAVAPEVAEAVKPMMVEKNPSDEAVSVDDVAGGWPPPLYVTSGATKAEVYYMKNRWQTQWLYYDAKATENKRKHQAIQVFIGIASVSVPVLLTAASTYPDLTLVASIVSACVAGAAAIENVKKYGDNWRTYRSAAEDLAREKSMYDVTAGPYRTSKRAFLRFVERCEDIMSQQNGQWHQRGEENVNTQAPAAAGGTGKDDEAAG